MTCTALSEVVRVGKREQKLVGTWKDLQVLWFEGPDFVGVPRVFLALSAHLALRLFNALRMKRVSCTVIIGDDDDYLRLSTCGARIHLDGTRAQWGRRESYTLATEGLREALIQAAVLGGCSVVFTGPYDSWVVRFSGREEMSLNPVESRLGEIQEILGSLLYESAFPF